jgi:hypothetical protein
VAESDVVAEGNQTQEPWSWLRFVNLGGGQAAIFRVQKRVADADWARLSS